MEISSFSFFTQIALSSIILFREISFSSWDATGSTVDRSGFKSTRREDFRNWSFFDSRPFSSREADFLRIYGVLCTRGKHLTSSRLAASTSSSSGRRFSGHDVSRAPSASTHWRTEIRRHPPSSPLSSSMMYIRNNYSTRVIVVTRVFREPGAPPVPHAASRSARR